MEPLTQFPHPPESFAIGSRRFRDEGQRLDSLSQAGFLPHGFPVIAFCLDVQPISWTLPEICAQPYGHSRCDRPAAQHDFVDGPRRGADGSRQSILGDTKWIQKILFQNFTGGDGGRFSIPMTLWDISGRVNFFSGWFWVEPAQPSCFSAHALIRLFRAWRKLDFLYNEK